MTDDETVHAVAAAALGTPGVVGPATGRYGEIGTYVAGGRVPGVRPPGSDSPLWSVHVVVAPVGDLRAVGDAVRARVAAVVGDGVEVVVADLDLPDPALPDPALPRPAATAGRTTPEVTG